MNGASHMDIIDRCLRELAAPQPTTDVPTLLKMLQAVRIVLSSTSDSLTATCDAIVALNGIPILHSYLKHPNPEFVLEAAWALTNIASITNSQHCETLVDADIHKDFIALLDHPREDVVEQALWALGNIAGDCAALRNVLLNEGIAPIVCSIFTRDGIKDSLKENAAWVVSTLCRHKPRPTLDQTLPIIVLLSKTLKDVGLACATDRRESKRAMLSDMLWSLCYLTENENSIDTCIRYGLIEALLSIFRSEVKAPGLEDSAVVPRRVACEQLGDVLEFLPYDHLARLCTVARDVTETTICDNSELYNRLRARFSVAVGELRSPALRIIGNVVAGTAAQTQAVIACGALELIEAIVELPNLKPALKGEIAWTLSNIAAEREVADFLFRKRALLRFVSDLFKLACVDAEKMQQEACYVVHNVLSALLSDSEIAFAARSGLMERLVLPAMACAMAHDSCRSILEPEFDDFGTIEGVTPADEAVVPRRVITTSNLGAEEGGDCTAEAYLLRAHAALIAAKRDPPLDARQVTFLLWRSLNDVDVDAMVDES